MIPKAFALWLFKKKEKNLSDFFPLFCTAASQQLLFISICAPFTEQHPCYQESVQGRWHRWELFLFCFWFFANNIQWIPSATCLVTPQDVKGGIAACRKFLFPRICSFPLTAAQGKMQPLFPQNAVVTTRPTPALWCIIKKNVGTRQQIFRYELISCTQIQRTSTNTLVARDTRAGVDTSVYRPCQTACNTLV